MQMIADMLLHAIFQSVAYDKMKVNFRPTFDEYVRWKSVLLKTEVEVLMVFPESGA